MLTIRIKRKKAVDMFFSVLIILLPFLYQYKGIGDTISFGEMVLIPFLIYYILQMIVKKRVDNIDWALLMFYIVGLLMTLINSFDNYFDDSAALSTIVRLIYYMFLVYIARKHFDLLAVKKFYLFCMAISSIYLLMQFIMYYQFGTILPIYLKNSWQFPPEARPENFYQFGYRPSSLFLEPSYYALFVSPGIAILLFSKEKTLYEKVLLVLSCVGVLLSTSSGGLIGIGILFALKVFKHKNNHDIKALASKVAVIVMGIAMVVYVLYTQNSRLLRERLLSGASIGQRTLRGIIVYGKLSFFHKIFGVGINNMGAYMVFHNIFTLYDESHLNNCATLVQSLVYFGIIGFLFLAYYLWTLLRKSKGNIGFPMAILIIYMMCYENMMYYFRFAFLIIILEAINRLESQKIEVSGKLRKE